jgi:flagellum-specific peptidoglycan hydrolase FlgJ
MNIDIVYQTAFSRLQKKFTVSQSMNLSRLITAQAIHESNNFQSNVFKKNNNAFGYKYFAKSPYQLGSGTKSPESDNYAKYKDLKDSTLEVSDWILRRYNDFNNVTDYLSYANALKKNGYYGDSIITYSNALKHYLFNLPKNLGQLISDIKKKIL